jgi:hypothetical protein
MRKPKKPEAISMSVLVDQETVAKVNPKSEVVGFPSSAYPKTINPMIVME